MKFLYMLAAMCLGFTLAYNISIPVVQAISPDPRIHWESRDVTGYKLVNPAHPDTTVVLPRGSVLWLPRIGRQDVPKEATSSASSTSILTTLKEES